MSHSCQDVIKNTRTAAALVLQRIQFELEQFGVQLEAEGGEIYMRPTCAATKAEINLDVDTLFLQEYGGYQCNQEVLQEVLDAHEKEAQSRI